ncbi:S-layer homology domain-containing protein [bacterium]|nr:S-layer homology domain-containing protein [bacterium]
MKTKIHIRILYLSFSLIIAILASVTVFASTFSDVPYGYPYSASISFLKSSGVIDGYPDGTFKPDAQINRAEFLKIALNATNVKLDESTPTGFTDTDESAWYSPYLRKAKAEGWVKGYPDGTFKPGQAINKVEALKILGEIQNWNRLTPPEVPYASFKDTYRFVWYSPYIYFAKENNLLFKETDYFYPDQKINRGYMAELVYRTTTNNVINYEADKTVEEKIIEEKTAETPSKFKMIDKNYFDGLTLESNIPNVMYKNEIYLIKGTLTKTTNDDGILAFLSQDNNGTINYTNFIGTLHNKSFSIPIVFRKSGTFRLGIVPSLSGESKIIDITVLDGIPESGTETNDDIPRSIDLSFKNDKTTVDWDSPKNNIFRVYFMQGDKLQSYLVRDRKTLTTIFKDFKFFNEGKINVRVYGAQAKSLYPTVLNSKWASSVDFTFNAITHKFKLSYDDSITYSTLPEIIDSIQKIYVSGTTYEDIFDKGAVITPSGDIETFDITTDSQTSIHYGHEVIQSGSNFSFIYNPHETGTYILEINNTAGSALVNIPIYIGNSIPLIPDFFDLQDPLEKTSSLDLDKSRLELLDYINTSRQKYGLNPVKLVPKLDTLAQNHTDDMSRNNFFAHVNLQGETPNDRRIKLSIYTDVGENLALAPTVYFAHEALMRSAIHRKNILTSYWDTIGIGITVNNDGDLLIAEEFSHEPWTKQDMQDFEYYILDNINEQRNTPLQIDTNFQIVARNWSTDMINQNYFSFISPTGKNLTDMVQDNGLDREGRAYILKEGSIESLSQELLEKSDIMRNQWSRVGFGLTQDLWSTLYLTVIFK